jgi:hypothetical protein
MVTTQVVFRGPGAFLPGLLVLLHVIWSSVGPLLGPRSALFKGWYQLLEPSEGC